MHVSNYCSSPLLIDTIVIIVQSSNQCLLSLVQADGDVTTDAGRQVDLGLEVELDADEQSGVLLLALSVDSALEELACWVHVHQYGRIKRLPFYTQRHVR